MVSPKRWRAWFSNYQDLSHGILVDPELEKYRVISGQNSDFEVVNAMYYDGLVTQLAEAERLLERVVPHIIFSANFNPRETYMGEMKTKDWIEQAQAWLKGRRS